MTLTQLRTAINRIGFPSKVAAAKFLGVAPRTMRGWKDQDVPLAVAKLLRLMIRMNLKPEDVK